ncbi:MAG: SdrD B-like domain-containing protein, partial [Tepidisphaeraceae bacterium]
VKVDNSGALVGGVPGDDFVMTGDIDADGDSVVDYSGVLLTGEITAVGFEEDGATDQYDMRFTVTGGALAPLYAFKDIGVTVTSDNSTFSGAFNVDFSGGARGNVGAIDKLPPPPECSLSGFVYQDLNNDGLVDFGEREITGVQITLTGTDVNGNPVNMVTQTEGAGFYMFSGLIEGTYTLTETQPGAYNDGKDTLGTTAGTTGNDVFSNIVLAHPNCNGTNYNFGERPVNTGAVGQGQTATIGFWHNKNGQNLIKSLNGGATATQLGNWLGTTFPNMYGANAGPNNLAGKTNAQIAQLYIDNKFKVGGQKLDAQVLATAFAVYSTSSILAGNVAAPYGFTVSTNGTGTATINVKTNGAAFGVANHTVLSVMDCLLATDSLSAGANGVLYNDNTALRNMANAVYTMINENGDIA